MKINIYIYIIIFTFIYIYTYMYTHLYLICTHVEHLYVTMARASGAVRRVIVKVFVKGVRKRCSERCS